MLAGTRAAAAVLLLAAVPGCSHGGSDPEPAATPSPIARTSEDRGPMVNSSAQPHAVPAAILGKWGRTAGDCGHPADDGQGVMVVRADGFDLYEAHAQLAAVVSASDDRLRAAFAFAGERQNSTREIELTLQSDGKSLIRREVDGDPPAVTRYLRCPRSSQGKP